MLLTYFSGISCIGETTFPAESLKYIRKSSPYNDPRCSVWYDILLIVIKLAVLLLIVLKWTFDLAEIRVEIELEVSNEFLITKVSWVFNCRQLPLNCCLRLWLSLGVVKSDKPKAENVLLLIKLCALDKRVMEKGKL